MSKTLIIAEKPSVSADLARVLAKAPGMTAFKKEKDYFENDTHIITSAVGHLLEQEMPMKDGKKIGWGFTTLPILPEKFDLKPISTSAERYRLVAKMIKRKDVTSLINACDAGREGELIFRNIIEATSTKKPIQRMWMQSMTNASILEAFQKLRSGDDLQPLADAAKCRSESDWIIGINGTRAMTALNSRHGGFRLTPVGRVQTPTLSILAKREHEIAEFVPRTYYEVHATFDVKAGSYTGRWLQTPFKKDDKDEHKKAERIWDLAEAQAIVDRCLGQQAKIEEVTKPTKQIAPLLYDLTSLQREASNRYGFSARRTLQLAQTLYEKYKVLTYPRTDSRYLPNDYLQSATNIISDFSNISDAKLGAFPAELRKHCQTVAQKQWVKPNRRVFDSSKVSDHFAIIPTGQIPPASMGEAERKLYTLVTQRFIAVFFPAAEFDVTTRFSIIADDRFKSEGKVMRQAGWQAVYGKQALADLNEGETSASSKVLVAVDPQESAKTQHLDLREESTKAPPRYNEATLLSTMEGAGKFVDDEELANAMSERGLGTPATRAAIIEGLIMDKYIEREGRDFIVTTKGLDLIDQLQKVGVNTLSSPELTGQWEYKLRQMEQSQLDRPTFMKDIRDMAASIVEKSKAYVKSIKEQEFPDLEISDPESGAESFKQTADFYEARTDSKPKLRVYKHIAGKDLSEEQIRELITKRQLAPLDGFRSRIGKEFRAGLEIKPGTGKVSFVFEKGASDVEEIHWDELPVLCACPVCQKNSIYILPEAYACRSHIEDKSSCSARLARELCKKEITADNAKKFFLEGKTGKIDGMISKKNRPFSAFLVFKPNDKRNMAWEFPPREAKPKTPKK